MFVSYIIKLSRIKLVPRLPPESRYKLDKVQHRYHIYRLMIFKNFFSPIFLFLVLQQLQYRYQSQERWDVPMVVEKDEYTHAEPEETSCRLVYEILDKYKMVSCSALIDPLHSEQKTALPRRSPTYVQSSNTVFRCQL